MKNDLNQQKMSRFCVKIENQNQKKNPKKVESGPEKKIELDRGIENQKTIKKINN